MEEEKEYKDILKEYKNYMYLEAQTMTEAEYWRAKCNGEI